ncbi:hypothetical protein VTI28DRAFT_4241 [Corynascus sepedonium]
MSLTSHKVERADTRKGAEEWNMNRISNDTGGGTLKISTSSSSFRPPFLSLSLDKHRLPEMKMQRVQAWLAHLPADPDDTTA